MNLTLSIDDDTLRIARERAEALGTSVNQVVRNYIGDFAGKSNNEELWDEFRRLMKEGKGDSKGWKFNREEIHERR